MSSATAHDLGAGILTRAIQPGEGGLSADAARSLMELELSLPDRERVNELAAKARSGSLTPKERAELDELERVACLLELLQSKARLSLKRAGNSS